MDDESHCQYIVPLKKRRCRFMVKKGRKFCGEHAFAEVDADGNSVSVKRVPCPNNPNHTVNVRSMPYHLEKCPNRLIQRPWIEKDVNLICSNREISEKQPFRTQGLTQILELIENVFEKFVKPDLEIFRGSHTMIDDILKSHPEYGQNLRKHLLQQSAFLEILRLNGVLQQLEKDDNSESVIVEFGAGRAELLYRLAQCTQHMHGVRYLVVERSGVRNKCTNKDETLKDTNKLQRLLCSIEDLKLDRAPFIAESADCGVVGVWKHLCGQGTDLAINCIVNSMKCGVNMCAVVGAPCCHHKLDWSQLVAKDIMLQLGFNQQTFKGVQIIAAWATSSITDDGSGSQDTFDPFLMSSTKKEEMGRKMKAIIEWCRMKYLHSAGFTHMKLIEFVDKSITPENYLIFGKRS